MAERIPQSVAYSWVFRAYLSSDGVTPATGKTIAVTISKNLGAFGNPSAGATNATELSSGFYYWTSSTTDTGTVGPLAIRGAVSGVNDAGEVLQVAKATNAGFSALPDAAAEAAGGLYTRGTGVGQIEQEDNGKVSINVKQWLRGTIPAVNVTGVPKVDLIDWLGSAPAALTASGYLQTALLRWLTDNAAGTPNALISGREDVNAQVVGVGAIVAASFAANAVDAAALAADAATEIAAAVFARAFSAAYGSYTFDQLIKVFSAALAGICSGAGSAPGPIVFRNLANNADVISATYDANTNRLTVTLTP